MLKSLNIFLFTVGLIQSLAAYVNYCDPKICPHQGPHIRCRNNGRFAKACIGNYTLVNMKPYKKLILREHGIYRNILAEGKLKCFYPAVRMPAMKWNANLAENAEYNVKTCKFEHDNCRATPKFPYAGQNIYTLNTKNLNIDLKRYIEEAIFLWFEEFMHANYSVMESFVVTKPQTGHFTVLMNDRNTHVGCALLDNFLPGNITRRVILFTCNYSSTNINNYPSYRPGKPASHCKKTHRRFKSLCIDKNINANDISWYKK